MRRWAIGVLASGAVIGGAIYLFTSGSSTTTIDPCSVDRPPRSCGANYVEGVPSIDQPARIASQVWGPRFVGGEIDRTVEPRVLRLYVHDGTPTEIREFNRLLGPPAEYIPIEAAPFSQDVLREDSRDIGRLLRRYGPKSYAIASNDNDGRLAVETQRELPTSLRARIERTATVPVEFRTGVTIEF